MDGGTWEFWHRGEAGVHVSAARAYQQARRGRSSVCVHYCDWWRAAPLPGGVGRMT